MFHRGALDAPRLWDGEGLLGHLHVVVRGQVELTDARGELTRVTEPSVVFIPRATWHQMTPMTGTSLASDPVELVCARVDLGGMGSPMADSLPAVLVVPMDKLAGSQALLTVLWQEAFAPRCGHQAALDRLCELLLIHVFRFALEHRLSQAGALAGHARKPRKYPKELFPRLSSPIERAAYRCKHKRLPCCSLEIPMTPVALLPRQPVRALNVPLSSLSVACRWAPSTLQWPRTTLRAANIQGRFKPCHRGRTAELNLEHAHLDGLPLPFGSNSPPQG